jgi:hypothetical protein
MEPIQRVETASLLRVAIDAAYKWETPLGKGRKGKAERAFEALDKGRLELGHPQAKTQRLRPRDFEERGLALSPEVKKSMRGQEAYAFYVVPVPVLLFPGRGAQYRLLESQFTFRARRGERQPAIHSIFPEPLWKPVLNWGGRLDLALDGNLKWGAEVEQTEARIGKLSSQLAGRVGNLNQLTGFIKIVPFEHSLGRMEIEAQHSDRTAMWRLDSQRAIRGQKQTRLVVLLQAPKKASQVRLEAAAQAEVAFDWLTAQVSHVFDRLPEAIQHIIKREKGLPLQDFQTWTLDLPG